MEASLIIFLAVSLIIGAIVFAFVTLNTKGQSSLDVEKYRIKWLEIEQQLQKEVVSSHHISILNADKLLDKSLKERGFVGNTMGERMRSAQKVWSDANSVWNAHKLRNRIAHEPEVNLSYDQARLALTKFRQALKDVGAI